MLCRETYLISLLTLAIVACAKKTVDLEAYSDPYLVFGQGGGFTGERTEYILLPDGRTFRASPEQDSLLYVGKVSKNKAAGMYEEFDDFSNTEVNSPGNLYYYIEQRNGDKQKVLTWGDPTVQTSSELMDLWKALDELTKT